MSVEKILDALQEGDKTAGDLLDAGKYVSYTELNADLALLKQEGKITDHFHPHGYKLYSLSQNQKPRSILPWRSN